MIRDAERPEHYALPSQAENLPERPIESLFGNNPSGWSLGQMGQIHIVRASPLQGASGELATDEFPLPKEAIDERHGRS